jgi:hypothetical protein
MPICCSVMTQQVKAGDTTLRKPPKGAGATLTIRYKLPR